jgi:hypothetical protein
MINQFLSQCAAGSVRRVPASRRPPWHQAEGPMPGRGQDPPDRLLPHSAALAGQPERKELNEKKNVD